MMTDFDFVIPLTRNDLLHKPGVSNYAVEEVFPVRLLPGKLKGICENIIRDNFNGECSLPPPPVDINLQSGRF